MRMWRGAGVLLGMVVALGECAPPAEAIPRIRIPAIHELPAPRIAVPRPASSGLAELTRAGKYGVIDNSIIASLDDAGRGLGDDIDNTAGEVGANSEARLAFRECAGEGLGDAGTSYRDALRDATPGIIPAPDFGQVVDGAAGCLQSYFPEAPAATFEIGKQLAALSAKRAQEASVSGGSGAVLAEWMITTGPQLVADVEASIDEPISTISTGSGTTSAPPAEDSFPWWAALAVLVALGGGGALLLSSKKS